MDSEKVSRDVNLAVAKVVFGIPPNDNSNFNQDLVPANGPPNGLEATRASWLITLNEIEAELHETDPVYGSLNLDLDDADKTLNIPILDISIHIRMRILKNLADQGVIANIDQENENISDV